MTIRSRHSFHLFPVLLVCAFGLGAMTLGTARGAAPLRASLGARAVVPGPGDGHASGRARLSVDVDAAALDYALNVEGLRSPTGARLHRACAGGSGPAMVTLDTPDGGHASGRLQVDRELLRNIVRHPDHYYVEVTSAAYPSGAVRGQLAP